MKKLLYTFLPFECVLLIFCMLLSYLYWGYFWSPPSILSSIHSSTEVYEAGFFHETELQKTGRKFWREKKYTTDSTPTFRTHNYFIERNKNYSPAMANGEEAIRFIREVQKFFPKKTPFKNSSYLFYKLHHSDHGLIHFVAGRSGQYSNDRYRYIETVFKQNSQGIRLIEKNQFNVDTDGLEGMTAFRGFIALNILFALLGLATLILWKVRNYFCKVIYALIFIAKSLTLPFSKLPLIKIIGVMTVASIFWFVSFDAGQCGEVGAVRLRFSVYEWEGFGETDLWDLSEVLFSFDLTGASWGGVGAIARIGGVKEYFGLAEPNCRYSNRPPIPDSIYFKKKH